MQENIKEFINTIKTRGFIHQTTDLEELQSNHKKIIGYTGFDCTSNTLHVGSLLQLMLLKWLQKTGNKPIVLLGGGTTKIGDPSGKDSTRKILSSDKIKSNSRGIKSVVERFIDFDDKVCIRIPRRASFNLKNVMKEVSKFEDKFEIELKFRNPYLTAYGWKKVEYPKELNKNEKKIV